MAWLNMSFESSTLHMPVMLDVLIPQGRGDYKCLYLLHGAGGDHESWLTKSRVADFVEGTDIAVVMPSGDNRFYINNRHGKDYYTFITSELIKNCETWFDISKEASKRYIAGMSMGGYGAFNAALNNPELYSAAFSYSGLLNVLERYDNPQGLELFPVFGERQELIDNGYNLFDKSRESSGLFIENVENTPDFHVFCGEQDPRISMSRDMHEHLKTNGYKVKYYEEAGAHNWDYWDKCIKQTIDIIK